MLDVILFSVIVFIFILLIVSFAEGNTTLGLQSILLFAIFVLWFSFYGFQNWEYKRKFVVESKQVNSIDVLAFDNRVVNLNELFQRDFDDGEKILVKERDTDRHYYGIINTVAERFEIEPLSTAEESKD